MSHNRLIRVNNTFHVPSIVHRTNYALRRMKAAGHARTGSCHRTIGRGATLLVGMRADGCDVRKFAGTVSRTRLITLNGRLSIPMIASLNDNSLISLDRCNLPGRPVPRRLVTTNIDLIDFSNSGLLNKPRTKVVINGGRVVTHLRDRPLGHTLHTSGVALTTLRTALHLCLRPRTLDRGLPALHLLAHDTRIVRVRTRHLRTPLTTRCNTRFTMRIVPYLSRVNDNSLPISHLPDTTLAFAPRSKHNDRLRSLTTH